MKIRKWLIAVSVLMICSLWVLNASEVRPLLSSRPEKIYAFSLCSQASASVATSRANVMKYLAGMDVDQDRTYSPGAAYLIPHNGWQLHDMVSTAFTFWNGDLSPANSAIQNEKGHRLVLGLILKGDVRKYWCRITSTSTNVPFAMFNIATNSSTGQEILFNPQFVGISFGPNGKLESEPQSDGSWNQLADDKVYRNSERPSLVQYDVAIRFGASVTYFANQAGDFVPLADEFANKTQSLKAELMAIEGGTERVADSYTIATATPRLSIVKEGTQILVGIVDGQKMVNYYIQSTTQLGRPWTFLHTDPLFSGRVWYEPIENHRFFRIYSGPVPPVVN